MNVTNAFTTLFTVFFVTLFMGVGVGALPLDSVALSKKDVFVPHILEPNADTVWTSGQIRNITWDTSDAPAQITNGKGLVLIRFEEITAPIILASGFDILDGSVAITVPLVETRTDWSIVLFGDSGNFSPNFEIIGQEIP